MARPRQQNTQYPQIARTFRHHPADAWGGPDAALRPARSSRRTSVVAFLATAPPGNCNMSLTSLWLSELR